MKEFFIVSNQLCLFLFLYVVGIISVKLKILNQVSLDSMAKFIVNITMPLMLFVTITNGPNLEDFKNVTLILILYPLFLAILYLISSLIVKLVKIKAKHKNLFKATFMFANAGFIGIPLTLSLFPNTGVIYISGCMIVDQLLLWTIGVYFTKPIEENSQRENLFKHLKKMLNPCLIAILVAVLFLIFNLKLPEVLNTYVTKVGDLTTALALIYIGGLFCYTNIKTMTKNVETYLIVAVKMLLIPLSIYFLCKLTGFLSDLVIYDQIKAMLIILSLPSMSSLVMLAKINKTDSDYVLGNVTLTTMFSLITVPIVTLIFNSL